jgi:prephenate dehydrogenase
MKIGIVGGTGGMGRLLAKSLKGEIYIFSRDREKAKNVALELSVKPGTKYSDMDIVIVSVPMNKTAETCSRVASEMKDGSLLIDVSSVKKGIADKVKVPPGVAYISVHPLFGPDVGFENENIIIIPVKENGWLKKLETLLAETGAKTRIGTIEEHDDMMGAVQALHHFSYLCLEEALKKESIPEEFYTHSFKRTLEFLKIFDRNREVVIEIQKMNPNAKKRRKDFAKVVKKMVDEF